MHVELLKDREHVLESCERLEIHQLEQRHVEMSEAPQLEWMA
jgi:hypothetical protein